MGLLALIICWIKASYRDLTQTVLFFYRKSGPHGHMSNFYPAPVTLNGYRYPTSEHVYHTLRTPDSKQKRAIAEASTPMDAANLGRNISSENTHSDWKTKLRYPAMLYVVLEKYMQHPELAEKLIATGDTRIVEHSPYDPYWGDWENGTGQNKLGEVLEIVRNILNGKKMIEESTALIMCNDTTN